MKAMKSLYIQDKPREKMLNKGVEALKNEELLAILLGTGIQGKDVRQLAKEIVTLLDDNFAKLSMDTLCQIHGLGPAKASKILASIELSKRYLIRENRRITTAEDVYNELYSYRNKKQEYFLVLTLDGASHLISTRIIFIGTVNKSMVHPREVFADAITDHATGMIIAHNHPAGTLNPSDADLRVTKRLKEVAHLVGIELLDHVIIAKNGFYSFAENELL